MKCPVCPNSVLTLNERQGIEIDFCPHCRGVWLDRGELDKIIDRTTDALKLHRSPADEERSSSRRMYEKEHSFKKRKSFLEELFD